MKHITEDKGRIRPVIEGDFQYDENGNSTRAYEILSIVGLRENGVKHSYISKKAVPKGIPITNEEYWYCYHTDEIIKDFVLPWFEIETDDNNEDWLSVFYGDDNSIKDFTCDEYEDYIEIAVIMSNNDTEKENWDDVEYMKSCKIVLTEDIENAVCPIELKRGWECNVIYENQSKDTEFYINISPAYRTPDGSTVELSCPPGGYCEVNWINIAGNIYVRGV